MPGILQNSIQCHFFTEQCKCPFYFHHILQPRTAITSHLVIATPNDISYKEASIGIVGFLHLTVFIFLLNLYQFLILCSSNALLFVKLYFPPF